MVGADLGRLVGRSLTIVPRWAATLFRLVVAAGFGEFIEFQRAAARVAAADQRAKRDERAKTKTFGQD
jgi:hypothetical protein